MDELSVDELLLVLHINKWIWTQTELCFKNAVLMIMVIKLISCEQGVGAVRHMLDEKQNASQGLLQPAAPQT